MKPKRRNSLPEAKVSGFGLTVRCRKDESSSKAAKSDRASSIETDPVDESSGEGSSLSLFAVKGSTVGDRTGSSDSSDSSGVNSTDDIAESGDGDSVSDETTEDEISEQSSAEDSSQLALPSQDRDPSLVNNMNENIVLPSADPSSSLGDPSTPPPKNIRDQDASTSNLSSNAVRTASEAPEILFPVRTTTPSTSDRGTETPSGSDPESNSPQALKSALPSSTILEIMQRINYMGPIILALFTFFSSFSPTSNTDRVVGSFFVLFTALMFISDFFTSGSELLRTKKYACSSGCVEWVHAHRTILSVVGEFFALAMLATGFFILHCLTAPSSEIEVYTWFTVLVILLVLKRWEDCIVKKCLCCRDRNRSSGRQDDRTNNTSDIGMRSPTGENTRNVNPPTKGIAGFLPEWLQRGNYFCRTVLSLYTFLSSFAPTREFDYFVGGLFAVSIASMIGCGCLTSVRGVLCKRGGRSCCGFGEWVHSHEARINEVREWSTFSSFMCGIRVVHLITAPSPETTVWVSCLVLGIVFVARLCEVREVKNWLSHRICACSNFDVEG